MKKLLIGLASLPFLVDFASAGQPNALSDRQMDRVVAGQFPGDPAVWLTPASNFPVESLWFNFIRLGISYVPQQPTSSSEGFSSVKLK